MSISAEARPSSPPPALKDCVSTLTAPNATSPSLALSLLGLCYHIGCDQAKISKLKSKNETNNVQLSEIPAMRELLSNATLFNKLVSMLNPPMVSQGGTNLPQQMMTTGRKRAPSEDFTHPRKRQMLSPVPNRQSNEERTPLPVESTSVLAATCLYTVLQHIDHWPLTVMKAFATDCFGSRIWVDDAKCSLIVANLEQSIKIRNDDNDVDEEIISTAEESQKYFSSLDTSSKNNVASTLGKSSVTNVPIQMKQPSSKEKLKLSAASKMDVETSSSSGEEEVLMESEILPSFSMTTVQEQSNSTSGSCLDTLFSTSYSVDTVRSRYFSSNIELMDELISDALEERLNSKSKQNSRLLQTLPLFLRIPRVRVLASRHLERWLQSPALAGLARTLFGEIVQHVEKVHPPLFDDLEVVDNILKLKLKANQLGVFVEHITTIVKMLPSVARQVFTHCISQNDATNESGNKRLNIFRAVYVTMDKKDAAKTLAASIIALELEMRSGSSHGGIILQYQDFHAHLCKVVETLGTSFDGFQFATSIIEAKMGTTSKQIDAINSSRLIFFCATLATRSMSSLHDQDADELSQFRTKMLKLRKSIMRWCINDLCSTFRKKIAQEEERRCADSQFERGAVLSGPGVADYSSLLDASTSRNICDQQPSFNTLISIMRCLMFISHSTSSDMEYLVGEYSDSDHCKRVDHCCKYGVDIDDELIQLVINSESVTPITAISIVEILLERCKESSTAKVVDCRVDTLMNMYKLAEFKPLLRESITDEDGDQITGVTNNVDLSSLPRLAVTSSWWRVSCIILVFSGIFPEDAGSSFWSQHPTLKSLIKMSTSQKYRFPTADCDESERCIIKESEAKTREIEANIVEKLFMPAKQQEKKQPKAKSPKHTGIRFSARQREKQERHRKIEEERKAATFQAEQLKLKKVLRSMQKNIMLFDPKQHQRKPPKGSIDLLLSVNTHFDLASKFRRNITPDFLLKTIGEGRSAIERAYDWLIPVISSNPEIIHRLQPNASCYLLLRAYGSIEGEKNRDLLDLTKPLLCHVKGCLTGEHGEKNAMMAMDLLMADIADERVIRRVCSRRVLQEAFGGENDTSWLFALTHDKHSVAFIPLVRRAVSRACAYERGHVLSTYILALSEYRECIQANDFNFVSLLCDLISNRPHVFAEAFRIPELRRLCISEVKRAIDDAMAPKHSSLPIDQAEVTITLNSAEYVLGSNIIGACIVIMSNWEEAENVQESERDDISALLKLLLTGEKSSILSTAIRNGKRAVSVEEWVLLATSNSDVVAKQAALSVPDVFLPRLLLCCGMSRTSFVTMLERLSELAASVSDLGKLYNELLCTSAVNEWGLQKGHRAIMKKRLHGRIDSYMRILSNTKNSSEQEDLNKARESAFVKWLASEISEKKSGSSRPSFDNFHSDPSPSVDSDSFIDLEEDAMNLCVDEVVVTDGGKSSCIMKCPTVLNEKFIQDCVAAGEFSLLEEALERFKSDAIMDKKDSDSTAIVITLLKTYISSECDSSLGRIVLNFVPVISHFSCNSTLWQILFIDLGGELSDEQFLVSLVSGCMMNWSDERVVACRQWILDDQNEVKTLLSLRQMLRFLVVSVEHEPFISSNCEDSFYNEKTAKSVMRLVLRYLEMTNDVSFEMRRCQERNDLPDWLILTCIMAKSHHKCISKILIQTFDSPDLAPIMHSVLLRLYLMFPAFQWSDATVRKHLAEAAKVQTKISLRWRCPLDSQVSELLHKVGTSPHTRLLQSATDFAKTHALIVIRHLRLLHERLVADGLGDECTRTGRVGARQPTTLAQIGDQSIKVSITRWGFSYNEQVWNSVLDIMMSLPYELLFTSGVEAGLLLILEDFLKLFHSHVIDIGSEECIAQLRSKYLTLINSFQTTNSSAFQKWTQTNVGG